MSKNQRSNTGAEAREDMRRLGAMSISIPISRKKLRDMGCDIERHPTSDNEDQDDYVFVIRMNSEPTLDEKFKEFLFTEFGQHGVDEFQEELLSVFARMAIKKAIS